MVYIARAAVGLSSGSLLYQADQWYPIKTVCGIEYRWRLKKDNTFEVFAGVFTDEFEALSCAKQMYINILYTFYSRQVRIDDPGPWLYSSNFDSDKTRQISEESYVFYNSHYVGTFTGPAVYEVENSIDDFDLYKSLKGYISGSSTDQNINIEKIDQYVFSYNSESHSLLRYIYLAEQTNDYGMKMTIYCSILEHMAEDGYKSKASQAEIDALVGHVCDSPLSDEEKNQLVNLLESGRRLSARQKCVNLLNKYARYSYDGYTPKKIFDEAYSLRSAFAHGNSPKTIKASWYIKFVVLDVIKAYMRDKEGLDA